MHISSNGQFAQHFYVTKLMASQFNIWSGILVTEYNARLYPNSINGNNINIFLLTMKSAGNAKISI